MAFEALTKILVTPAVSALLGARVPIHPLVTMPHQRPYSPASAADPDSIKATLATTGMRGCTADDFSPDSPAIFEELVADFVAYGRGHAAHIHYSCALLSHLYTHGQPMLPYIELSEAPCVLRRCLPHPLGFEVTMRKAVRRRASDGWTSPDFPEGPEDAAAF